MEYSNPEIPEGINTSKQHPLKDFFLLSFGVLGCIVICAFILGLFAERLALYIPFSVEQELMAKIELEEPAAGNTEYQAYLDELGKGLIAHMDIPEEITITVNYVDEPIENAFATLGGHIFIYQGLIDLLPNENALAMVIAHEIAHIKYRDPIAALGRGVVVGLFLTAITGASTDRYISNIISETGTLTILGFNRNQERRADEEALRVLADYYGHVNGADTLFKTFLKIEDEMDMHTPEFFSTHPLSEDRISNIEKLANKQQWSVKGDLTQLPGFIQDQAK